jgi:two-component system nitrogen regulation response regulator NtrX
VIDAEDVRQVLRPGARTWTPPVPRPSSTTPGPEPVAPPAPPGATEGPATLREFKEWSERTFLVQRLREFGWNISRTAEVIDTPRSNLYKKLEQYNIRQETDG